VKIVVNWSRCDGNGLCAREAPELFAMDDDDHLIVRQEQVAVALLDKAESAVRMCPKQALSLED
jgi:ferredoxin